MAGILDSLKKFFNRRSHKRYFVKDGTLVVISPGNVENKEKLRQEALKQIQQVLTDETGKPQVDDLLFNNLIVQ